jgi:hypothetical protein
MNPKHAKPEGLINLRLIQGINWKSIGPKAQCPVGECQELRNVKSISNYDAISLRSVRYAKDWYDAEARRSELFILRTPRLDEELAGSIVTT